jgi:signal transduction histidine kinase
VTAKSGDDRLRRINGALIELARLRSIHGEDPERAFKEMTEVGARGIGVARASIWLCDPNSTTLTLADLWDADAQAHSGGLEIHVAEHPSYFRAIREARVITAIDATSDPRTASFAESYLRPLGIGALLDAPSLRKDELVGVVCLEHVGGPRQWTPEEELFAGSLSDQLSILLESAEARRIEDARHQSELRLQHSISLLQAAFESTADGLLVVNADGMITRYNEKFLSLFRIPMTMMEEPADERLLALVIAQLKEPELFLARVKEIYARTEESFDVIELHDGRVYERYSKPQTVDGVQVGRVWSFRDVTEERRHQEEARVLQAELIHAQKIEAIGTLAGGIAHDFNNILGVILGHAELAKNEIADPLVRNSLDEVLGAADRARALVQQILTFSRRRPEDRRILPLGEVIKDALKLLRASFPASIEIETELGDAPIAVHADIAQVHQVLMNLGTNAAHAMRERGGRFEVELSSVMIEERSLPFTNLAPGRYARLEVSDSGHGMDAETLAHIFEPFFTTKEPGEGTGLGLAVVLGIMQNHEGAITVKSTPEKGTTFELYFPEVDLDRLEEYATPRPPPEGRGQHILLVDDEPQLVASSARLLERLRYHVTGCTSASQALDTLKADPARFDLVITDLSMPKLNGLDFARECQRLRGDLPVIITSGFFGGIEVGNNVGRSFLTKPFNQRTLAEAVDRALRAS